MNVLSFVHYFGSVFVWQFQLSIFVFCEQIISLDVQTFVLQFRSFSFLFYRHTIVGIISKETGAAGRLSG